MQTELVFNQKNMSFWRIGKASPPSSGHISASWVFLLGCLCLVGGFFWFTASTINYPFHREVKENLVSHPEFIPQSDFAKITSLGHENAVADSYWL